VENGGLFFPRHGKVFFDFSTLWKTFFHTVEKMGAIGLLRVKIFHTMENFFPHCGIAECRAQAAGAERTRGL
jgi:hypothetical protein